MKARLTRLVIALGLPLLAAAIAVTPACAPTYASVGYEAYVGEPPPAPLVEAVPLAPGPAYVWVPGYWTWSGLRHVWVPGHWALPPSPAHVWIGARWNLAGTRYVFVPGHWTHHRHVAVRHHGHHHGKKKLHVYPAPKPVKARPFR